MAATKYVSFFEVRLAVANLLVRLGSGPDSEVMELPCDAPSIRVCMPEPPDAGLGIRVRFGKAELTDEGLMPIQGDAFEMRGARARLLGLGSEIIKALAFRWRAGGSEHALLATVGPGWLRVGPDGIERSAAADVRAAFSAEGATQDEGRSWVYVDMDTPQLDAFAAIITATEEEAVKNWDPGSP